MIVATSVSMTVSSETPMKKHLLTGSPQTQNYKNTKCICTEFSQLANLALIWNHTDKPSKSTKPWNLRQKHQKVRFEVQNAEQIVGLEATRIAVYFDWFLTRDVPRQ